ncbi:MAG: pobB 2 [Panacagrimonas sp.]|jgi:vanillate O-demethylase ferredoxin subunit|nr:PDR/VanB family oxidoreductase [Panacagrimonas sp.]MCC2657997.1 pobB 2 [Panacagrimonas sp.]
MAGADRITLNVSGARCEARDVLWLELRDPQGRQLPAFTAGAHLEIHLANGLVRHYSLCNDPVERDRYCLGVGLARDGRGGSKYVHEQLRVGASLSVSAPRNNFPLELAAQESVFIAGGIGITPIMAMIRACIAANRRWRLFYCARNRQRCAFYEDLVALAPDRCHFHFDDEHDGRWFDAAAVLQGISHDAHLYTCGPAPLMKAVEAAAADRPPDRVHFEWFTAAEVDTATDQPFTVILRNSGTQYEVPPGRSILEVLEDHDAGVPYSCREGLCATCRTTVLAGEVDHRDKVLSAVEKATNKEMMICVSRAKTAVLELEL